jgi:acetyl-CoA C-acetyltransferase
VLETEEIARAAQSNGLPMVKVAGSAIGTDSLALDARRAMLELDGAALSTQRALEQAGIEKEDLDIFELHDAYTIITTLSIEAAGFAEKGQGVHFGKNGEITLTGKLPIATFGGLKSRGHPVGATGVYQLVETYMQLTGTAGENQVPYPEFALVQNIGGTGATVVSHILQRCD